MKSLRNSLACEYDEDDKEADVLWESIDKRMDSHAKDRKEVMLQQEIEKYRTSNRMSTKRFMDLKRKLYTLSIYQKK
ncbi:hypothetical protein SUGI_0540410 [Cryptomeria japonica]|nr:hypothetical protein SUGI_0540410 [Cryptomeria japonica]